MGPFPKLLEYGATVVAIDIPGNWGKVGDEVKEEMEIERGRERDEFPLGRREIQRERKKERTIWCANIAVYHHRQHYPILSSFSYDTRAQNDPLRASGSVSLPSRRILPGL